MFNSISLAGIATHVADWRHVHAYTAAAAAAAAFLGRSVQLVGAGGYEARTLGLLPVLLYHVLVPMGESYHQKSEAKAGRATGVRCDFDSLS